MSVFAAKVGQFTRGASERIERTICRVQKTMFEAVIRDTPKLTGLLRGNWQASIRRPRTGRIGLRTMDETIGAMKEAVNSAKGNRIVYFRNNLPYACRIEFDGWSFKAPAGMFRKNVARFQQIVGEAIRGEK
jgi:hypothetical protein